MNKLRADELFENCNNYSWLESCWTSEQTLYQIYLK